MQFLAKVLFREIDFTEKTEPTTKLRPETEVPTQVPGRTSSKTIALFFLFLGRSELLVDSRWRVINGFSLGAHQFGYIAPREKKLLARHLLDNLCKNM